MMLPQIIVLSFFVGLKIPPIIHAMNVIIAKCMKKPITVFVKCSVNPLNHKTMTSKVTLECMIIQTIFGNFSITYMMEMVQIMLYTCQCPGIAGNECCQGICRYSIYLFCPEYFGSELQKSSG